MVVKDGDPITHRVRTSPLESPSGVVGDGTTVGSSPGALEGMTSVTICQSDGGWRKKG